MLALSIYSLTCLNNDTMQEWWMSMDVFMQSLWGIAIFVSLIFIGQMIMTFIGMDSDMDVDVNHDASVGEPFQLFTFRNFINFFLGFSWTGIALRPEIGNTFLLLVIAIVVGLLLVTAVMFIFKWMSKMEQSGNISVQKALGCKGTVYLPIPESRKGEGKVQITIQGAIREYNAITGGESLSTGTHIRVTEVLNDDLLLVEQY